MNELLVTALILPFLGKYRKPATLMAFLFAVYLSLVEGYYLATFFFILSIVLMGISRWEPAKYPLLFLAMFDLIGLVNSQNLLELFLYFELAIYASYFLIFGKENLRALFRYFIVNSIGSAFMIFAIALTFVTSGSLNYLTNPALVFFVLGLLIKLGMAPFQDWLVEIYHKVSLSLILFFSVVLTEVAPLALLMVVDRPVKALELLALFSMLLANLLALAEKDLIRLLALIDASNLAFDLLAISIATAASRVAAIYMMFSHVLAMALAFSVIVLSGSKRISRLYIPPALTAPFFAAFFILSGLPPFHLFPAKVVLFSAVFDATQGTSYLLLFNLLLNAMVALRVMAAAKTGKTKKAIPLSFTVLVWSLVLISLILGLFPNFFFQLSASQLAYLGGPHLGFSESLIPSIPASFGQTLTGLISR
ncbi:MAG TPA: hypothetical protein ENN60_03745 [archaeon]|nr:hypothetical protein [archaeon]